MAEEESQRDGAQEEAGEGAVVGDLLTHGGEGVGDAESVTVYSMVGQRDAKLCKNSTLFRFHIPTTFLACLAQPSIHSSNQKPKTIYPTSFTYEFTYL